MSHTHHNPCDYHPHEGSIHVFTFRSSDRSAIDAWVDILEDIQLQGRWYGKPKVSLLLDARQASYLPLRYLFECLSDYNRAYPDLTPPRVQMAYIHSPTAVILSIYYTLAELMAQPVTVEFFTEKAEGIAWLKARA